MWCCASIRDPLHQSVGLHPPRFEQSPRRSAFGPTSDPTGECPAWFRSSHEFDQTFTSRKHFVHLEKKCRELTRRAFGVLDEAVRGAGASAVYRGAARGVMLRAPVDRSAGRPLLRWNRHRRAGIGGGRRMTEPIACRHGCRLERRSHGGSHRSARSLCRRCPLRWSDLRPCVGARRAQLW